MRFSHAFLKSYFFIFLLFLIITSACSSEKQTDEGREAHIATLHESTCLITYGALSDSDTDHHNYITGANVKPSAPWAVHSSSPIPDGFAGRVPFIRASNNETKYDNTEIWIEWGRERAFYVYLLELDSWETVHRDVANTNQIVNTIFLANDGTVWGRTHSTIDNETSLLSRLNEETKKFELVYEFHKGGALEFDSNGVFWILIRNDGLYTFDTKSNVFTNVIDFPYDVVAEEMTITDQGDIYFVVRDLHQNPENRFPYFYPDSLLRFSSATNQLEGIPLPENLWPQGRDTLYAAANQLWLNADGYIDLETETWQLLDSTLAFNTVQPELQLKDSYGIYWFSLFSFDVPVGTAWYDTVSDKGCMYTTHLSTVVEDLDRNLWMFSDGNLYVWERGSQ